VPDSRLILVTGLSGSGKSQVLNTLEDAGLSTADNLPLGLLPAMLHRISSSEGMGPVVLAMDARDPALQEDVDRLLREMEEADLTWRLVFIEAEEETLFSRYQESRRPHPLARGGLSLREAIVEERYLLAGLRDRAHLILDTSSLTVHQLRERVLSEVALEASKLVHELTLLSFGFAYGLPPEATVVLDVRFLPNPFFVADLRGKTGLDSSVASYLWDREESVATLEQFRELLMFLLPRFAQEGKSHVTVAIGCTGGRHRSVAMVEALAKRLHEEADPWEIKTRHRQIQVSL